MDDPVNWLLANEAPLRLACFGGGLLLLTVFESLLPRRAGAERFWGHRLTNLLLSVIDTLTLRLLMPMLAVGAAWVAASNGWGLFNQVALPLWLAVLLTLVLLDGAIYWQHRVFHRVPMLWRLHAVHHTDQALDATSGLRFHPLEILLSMLIKMAIVVALGLPPVGVLLFEILLNLSSLFEHSNLRLPLGLDRVLRLIIVTPDMHRVHHSVHRDEHDRNFGFNLAVWDRLFGSYCAQPRDGHEQMKLGLPRYTEPAQQRLDYLLLQPFFDPPNETPKETNPDA